MSTQSPDTGNPQGFQCPHCKAWHAPGTTFCPMLGLPITQEQITPTTPAAPPPVPAVAPAPADTAAAAASQPAPAPAPVPAPAVPTIATTISDSDKKAGFRMVSVPRMTTYHMPGICVACGSPLQGSNATLAASASQTYGNMRTTLTLRFPLCNECHTIQDKFTKNSNKATWISFLSAVGLGLIFLVIGLATSTSSDKGSIWGVFVCGGLILWLILYFIINSALNRQLAQSEKDRHNVIGKAVGITSFSSVNVTFKFTNESFAALFEGLNGVGTDLLASALASLLKKK